MNGSEREGEDKTATRERKKVTPKRSERDEVPDAVDGGVPNVGEILKRLRAREHLSLSELAQRSGLSQSFLRAVERGESDIAIGRLAKVARVLNKDIASFLGLSGNFRQPYFVVDRDRFQISRGEGVRYEALRLPGVEFEIDIMQFEAGSGFDDARAHEGFDIVLVVSGTIVLTIAGVDYTMLAGECVAYAAGYEHRIRNAGKKAALVLGLTTGRMY